MKKHATIINDFINDAFDLKIHLTKFLPIKSEDLEQFLENAKMELANSHPGDGLIDCEDFYKEIVGDKHLADLAAWHIKSKDYIASTLELQQRYSKNLVLDFGGGIGTHALANAMSDSVEHVFFVDINQTNRDFVGFRAKQLGLTNKISFYKSIKETNIDKFDSIVCLDVLEHLPDPSSQLNIFYEIMKEDSVALLNWYFYRGKKNEYPFHIDDPLIINNFFLTLQSKFIEIFHPMLITTRAYKKGKSIR